MRISPAVALGMLVPLHLLPQSSTATNKLEYHPFLILNSFKLPKLGTELLKSRDERSKKSEEEGGGILDHLGLGPGRYRGRRGDWRGQVVEEWDLGTFLGGFR
jgi:hypothetical protein